MEFVGWDIGGNTCVFARNAASLPAHHQHWKPIQVDVGRGHDLVTANRVHSSGDVDSAKVTSKYEKDGVVATGGVCAGGSHGFDYSRIRPDPRA